MNGRSVAGNCQQEDVDLVKATIGVQHRWAALGRAPGKFEIPLAVQALHLGGL